MGTIRKVQNYIAAKLNGFTVFRMLKDSQKDQGLNF